MMLFIRPRTQAAIALLPIEGPVCFLLFLFYSHVSIPVPPLAELVLHNPYILPAVLDSVDVSDCAFYLFDF
jgi:hypothetical protein